MADARQPVAQKPFALDPRTRLVALSALLVGVFSAPGVKALLGISLPVLSLVLLCGVPRQRLLRRCFSLRWLFAGVLLMHLLLGSGRTLGGVDFLSLDGFYEGVLIVWRLGLASLCSAVFCWTTSPACLMQALWLNMGRLGRLPAAGFLSRHVALVFLWLPLVQDALSSAKKPDRNPGHPWFARFGDAVESFFLLMDGLFQKVDMIAVNVHCESGLSFSAEVSAGARMAMADRLVLLASAVFVPCWLWGVR
ncbi:energy-coupling factor transporter transmembrane component T [Syntrophotalea acetylenica]|uniref:energy-coupling factor transporter transmembrane component T n=1 Tax=Syntrophotalea acetylenica TaxID=29542 RepID=UPI002A36C7BE|nr:energy-coupling factor transporter transmembrane component T [Syntrophotalea acetylenica]MDY0261232.1 energy-coupling factor transporter transmembrane component T [Syntrophotalea acetylenica]